MPYWVPPIVNSWSKNGELPNTSPDRVEKPITNLTGDALARPPSWPSGAYQRPSRSSRWKLPVPPSGPPLCEIPIWCMVPAVGNGRSIRVSRSIHAEGRAHAVIAAQARDPRARAREGLVVQRVGDEQPRVAVVEDREAELDVAAPPLHLAE